MRSYEYSEWQFFESVQGIISHIVGTFIFHINRSHKQCTGRLDFVLSKSHRTKQSSKSY